MLPKRNAHNKANNQPVGDDALDIPQKTNAHREQRRANTVRPYYENTNTLVGEGSPLPPKTNTYHQTNNQPVILSVVEILLSE